MPGRSSSKYKKYPGYEAYAAEREAEENEREARMREAERKAYGAKLSADIEMQELRNGRGGKRKGSGKSGKKAGQAGSDHEDSNGSGEAGGRRGKKGKKPKKESAATATTAVAFDEQEYGEEDRTSEQFGDDDGGDTTSRGGDPVAQRRANRKKEKKKRQKEEEAAEEEKKRRKNMKNKFDYDALDKLAAHERAEPIENGVLPQDPDYLIEPDEDVLLDDASGHVAAALSYKSVKAAQWFAHVWDREKSVNGERKPLDWYSADISYIPCFKK